MKKTIIWLSFVMTLFVIWCANTSQTQTALSGTTLSGTTLSGTTQSETETDTWSTMVDHINQNGMTTFSINLQETVLTNDDKQLTFTLPSRFSLFPDMTLEALSLNNYFDFETKHRWISVLDCTNTSKCAEYARLIIIDLTNIKQYYPEVANTSTDMLNMLFYGNKEWTVTYLDTAQQETTQEIEQIQETCQRTYNPDTMYYTRSKWTLSEQDEITKNKIYNSLGYPDPSFEKCQSLSDEYIVYATWSDYAVILRWWNTSDWTDIYWQISSTLSIQ